jgi:hypothetical protein
MHKQAMLVNMIFLYILLVVFWQCSGLPSLVAEKVQVADHENIHDLRLRTDSLSDVADGKKEHTIQLMYRYLLFFFCVIANFAVIKITTCQWLATTAASLT